MFKRAARNFAGAVLRVASGVGVTLTVAFAAGLAGCGSAPLRPPLPTTSFLVAPAATPLGGLAQAQQVPPGRSGFRPMLISTIALQVRRSLIEDARVGIDLQTYHLADDAAGQQILRALRDAAVRGVRVRLLIDDFHSTGTTDLLLGLAA